MNSPPKYIDADLNSSRQYSISDPSINLSPHTIKALQSMDIDYLFPVQKEVLHHILSSSTNDNKWETLFKWSSLLPHPGDIMVCAPTGSGKTLAYAIPIVESLSHRSITCIRALIVVPTRDIVTQVKSVFERLCSGTDLRVRIAGAAVINPDDTDIIITTPGRLVDYIQSNRLQNLLQHLNWLVIDEADRLLNQSYGDWLNIVLDEAHSLSPVQAQSSWRSVESYRQEDKLRMIMDAYAVDFDPIKDGRFINANSTLTYRNPNGPSTHLRKLLFSATLTKNPEKLASLRLIRPQLFVTTSNSHDNSNNESVKQNFVLPQSLKQFYWVCDGPEEKPLMLLNLLYTTDLKRILCFTKSIESAERLNQIISEFLQTFPNTTTSTTSTCDYFASSLGPLKRKQMIQRFNSGDLRLLICTDSLARGVDLLREDGVNDMTDDSNSRGVDAIVNYDPCSAKVYVHRCGRTARAGQEGQAHSLLASSECRHWKEMMRKQGFMASTKKNKASKEFIKELEEKLAKVLSNIKSRINK